MEDIKGDVRVENQSSDFRGKAVSEAVYSPEPDTMAEIVDMTDELDFSEEDIQIKKIAAVWWEDITAYSRVEIPDDFDIFRLSKITVGLVWKETDDYVVLVQDYDLTNRGRGYRHNDFHIIPRGTIKRMNVMGEIRF